MALRPPKPSAALLTLLAVGPFLPGCVRQTTTLYRADRLLREAPVRDGNLHLRCVPEDAEVRVDGISQGTCRDFDERTAGLKVSDGVHRIQLHKQGYFAYETVFSPGGARAVLQVTLQPSTLSQGAE